MPIPLSTSYSLLLPEGIFRNQRGTLAALQPVLRENELVYSNKAKFTLFNDPHISLVEVFLDRNGVFLVSSCSSFWLGPCLVFDDAHPEEDALALLRRPSTRDLFFDRAPLSVLDVYSLRGIGKMVERSFSSDSFRSLDPDPRHPGSFPLFPFPFLFLSSLWFLCLLI